MNGRVVICSARRCWASAMARQPRLFDFDSVIAIVVKRRAVGALKRTDRLPIFGQGAPA